MKDAMKTIEEALRKAGAGDDEIKMFHEMTEDSMGRLEMAFTVALLLFRNFDEPNEVLSDWILKFFRYFSMHIGMHAFEFMLKNELNRQDIVKNFLLCKKAADRLATELSNMTKMMRHKNVPPKTP